MVYSKLITTAALTSAFAIGTSGAAWAQQATAEEVVEKTKQAAEQIAQGGEPALDQFRTKDSEYVWADTYVFVVNCETGQMAAHPINQKLEGMSLTELKDPTGMVFGPDLCPAAQEDQGGWVEYQWPKPGEEEPSRKFTYMITAEGTPYAAGAGIYDEEASIDQLKQVSGGQ